MKSEFKFLLPLSFYFISIIAIAQNTKKTDSLKSLIGKLSEDTSLVNTYNSLSTELRKIDPEEALEYAKKGITLAQKIQFKKGEANGFFSIAGWYFSQSLLDSSKQNYEKAFVLRGELNDKKGQAICLNNLGNINFNKGKYSDAVNSFLELFAIYEAANDLKSAPFNNIGTAYFYMGNYEDALKYYIKGLELFEKTGEPEKAINLTLGAGNVHAAMGKFENALKYYQKALSISTNLNNKASISKSLNNIGSIYESLHKNDTALQYYFKALKLKEELGDRSGVSTTLMNIGNMYSSGNTQNYEKALEYYRRALTLTEETKDKEKKAKVLINIGNLYSNKGELQKSIEYLKLGLDVSEQINSIVLMMKSNEELSALYYKSSDYLKAYNHYKSYTLFKDSLLNESNIKNIAELNTKYETEKKEKEIQSLNQERLIKDAQLESQRSQRTGFIIGIVLLLLIIALAYNRYRIKQKANVEIAQKNKEITESISYAKRIQTSFLTSAKYISQRLPDSFIFYSPRNIVSGDFYWLMEKNEHLYVCTADCTGHGIPGAFMSLISMGILNEIIYSKTHLTHTDEILNELRRIIILAVNPEGSSEEGKDGMDAVLCRFDFQKMELEYSAANNSFFIIRNGELLVFKPDKMPVGKHIGIEKPFTRTIIPIEKGDCIYTFSDGYADQFGGPQGKKFQSKRLKELFLNNCHKPMAVQKEIYARTIKEWQGNNEQVDDILVMGVRV